MARTLLLASATLVATGCGILPGPRPADHSVIVNGPDRIRTFTIVPRADPDGQPILCTLGAALPPVTGMLRGDPTAFEPIWLEKPGGRHVSIVWPEGFTARFEPAAVLRDERGVAVARAGTLVTLGYHYTP